MADKRVAYELAKKYGIDTTGMSPKEVWETLKEKGVTERNVADGAYDSKANKAKDLAKKAKGGSFIKLPHNEYAQICSAIRTTFTNAIPKEGKIFLDNAFYRFKYKKSVL